MLGVLDEHDKRRFRTARGASARRGLPCGRHSGTPLRLGAGRVLAAVGRAGRRAVCRRVRGGCALLGEHVGVPPGEHGQIEGAGGATVRIWTEHLHHERLDAGSEAGALTRAQHGDMGRAMRVHVAQQLAHLQGVVGRHRVYHCCRQLGVRRSAHVPGSMLRADGGILRLPRGLQLTRSRRDEPADLAEGCHIK